MRFETCFYSRLACAGLLSAALAQSCSRGLPSGDDVEAAEAIVEEMNAKCADLNAMGKGIEAAMTGLAARKGKDAAAVEAEMKEHIGRIRAAIDHYKGKPSPSFHEFQRCRDAFLEYFEWQAGTAVEEMRKLAATLGKDESPVSRRTDMVMAKARDLDAQAMQWNDRMKAEVRAFMRYLDCLR